RMLENRAHGFEGGQPFGLGDRRRRARRRGDRRGGEQPDRADHASFNGSCRSRRPVAAKTAFATAGAIGGVPGSPAPPDFSPLQTMWPSLLGISFRGSPG